MNKITLEELGNITPILSLNNVKAKTEFDYFRIVKYNDDKVIKTKEHVLYFPITIAKKDLKTGWYNKELDLKQYIVNIANNNPEYTYVIEPDMVDKLDKKVAYIVVDNIMNAIEDLFKYVLNQYKGKVICVTGSVGKTTTVGFIKQVLGNKCLRIYSKRITPLVLKCFCINYLTNEYDYLALEASLWYKEHITYFSKTLKPDLSILLDVFEEHIGVGDIKTISDITKFKSLLLQYSKNAIINGLDKEIAKVSIKDGYVYYNKEQIVKTDVNNLIVLNELNKEIKPYINTNLTVLEETIAYMVGEFYNLPKKVIMNRLNRAIPVEKRIKKETLLGHQIIFDGDVSGVARINNLSNHFYKKSCLIICNLTENGEENEPYEKLVKVFPNYNKIYVRRGLEKYFKNYDIELFDNLSFVNKISNDTMIFVHYGSYYRKYHYFSKNNLEKR